MKLKNKNNLKVNLDAMKEIKASDIEKHTAKHETSVLKQTNNTDQNQNIGSQNIGDATTKNSQEQKSGAEKQTPKLTKKQELLNTLKFALFSISAGVIQMLSFTLLSEFVFHDANNQYGISYFISLALSVVWNFTFNRKFTFKSAKNVPIAMMLVFVYYCAFTPLSIWWGVELVDNLSWNNYLVLFLTMVVNMATEYLWTRYVVYRNDLNTAAKKERKNKEDKKLRNQNKKEDKKLRKNKLNKNNASTNVENAAQSTKSVVENVADKTQSTNNN